MSSDQAIEIFPAALMCLSNEMGDVRRPRLTRPGAVTSSIEAKQVWHIVSTPLMHLQPE